MKKTGWKEKGRWVIWPCQVEQSRRHPSGEVEMVGGRMSLELREAWATDKNEATVTMWMLFKVMGLDELSEELRVNKREKV